MLYSYANNVMLQAVKIVHASGEIRTATFLQFESQMTTQSARITAMHRYNPIYRFMCDQDGVMVHANKMAWEAYKSGAPIALLASVLHATCCIAHAALVS